MGSGYQKVRQMTSELTVFVGYLHRFNVKVNSDVFSRLLLTLTVVGVVATGSCSAFRQGLAPLTSEFSTFLLLLFCLDKASMSAEIDNV